MMSLETIVQQVADAFDASPPAPVDGTYTFDFDGTIPLTMFEKDDDTITLHSQIAKPIEDGEDAEKLVKQIMQWNFATLKDHEENMSWDPDTKQIFLYKEVKYSTLSEIPMLKHIENFLNSIDYWNNALKEGKAPAGKPF